MSISSFDRLLLQIDLFIRKFYRNQLVKGVIWFIGIFLFTFILITTLEYFGRFNTPVRAFLFFSFIGVNVFILIKYIVHPLLQLFSFGKRINRFQASEIIGQFFPNISDRLVNTLQLNADLSNQTGNIELLRASVQQRSANLSIIHFSDAINVKENIKYVKWIAPIFLLLFLIAIVSPKLFTDGTKRVVQYNKEFIPEAPFDFIVANFPTEIAEGSDLTIQLKLKGNELPSSVYLVSPQGKQLMTVTGRNSFSAVIPKIHEAGSFYFVANDFSSKEYHFSIIGTPSLGKFSAELIYPKYLGKQNQTIDNVGDMLIPEGTIVKWLGVSKNTNQLQLNFGNKQATFSSSGFKVNHQFFTTTPVQLFLYGNRPQFNDTIAFNVNVIKDEYPSIHVEELQDSIATSVRYFSCKIGDDYGLTHLKFVYTITSKDGKIRKESMNVKPVAGLSDEFSFAVDFLRENIQLDDNIEYYFVVSDNDGVNGAKSTKSKLFVYQLPSLEQLNQQRETIQENSKENLQNLFSQSEKFMDDLKKLQNELLNSKSNNWKQKNKIEDLKKQHQELLKSLQETNKQLQQSTEEKSKLSKENEELLEKQQLLDELMEKLMDSDMMKLLDELEKLLEQNQKSEQQQKLDELKLSNEQMNKQLDRSIEMLKKMQVDEKIDAIENELKKLAEDQLVLKKEIETKNLDKQKALEEQSKINDQFNQLKEDLKKLEELNKELNRPMELPSLEKEQNSTEQELNNAQQNLSKSKNKSAGENQQHAAEQMQKMADQMDAAQNEANKEQQGEDMEMLRKILKSLVTLSFEQEQLISNFSSIKSKDPNYKKYGRLQRSIIDKTIPVKDSLYELAKRQPMLSDFVDKEIKTIQSNHKQALNNIQERNLRQLNANQQFAMTSYNNLALMLNESLQQMQQQMQAMMKGSGSCSNPGGKGKPSSGEGQLGNMKEQLKKQLEQMKNGSNPGGSEGGKTSGNGGQNGESNPFGLSNKELAKMAAEQGAIRRKLEELRKELNKDGKGAGNQLNPLIKELEKQEEELVNKKYSDNLLKRQQDILTRLLESEKAIRERGFEEKRESNSGKNENYGNQIRFDEYNKEKLKQIELLRTVDPVYNKYYKDKANQYFNLIK